MVLLLLSSTVFFAQSTITGIVKDNNNQAIPGVNIILKGTTLGTTSDFDGNYSIQNVPNGEYTLIASYVGYDNFKKQINVNAKNITVDIIIKENAESLDEIVNLAKDKENMLASIPAILPVKKEDFYVASGFQMRMHPILKINKFHKGMDFSAAKGTPIYASGNGRVILAERSSTYGNVVYISHGYGYQTIYAHMSKIATANGRYVKRGDLIGYVGNSGLSFSASISPFIISYSSITSFIFSLVSL